MNALLDFSEPHMPASIPGTWDKSSIDKIAIGFRSEYLAPTVYSSFQTGSVTVLKQGPAAFICFHAEALGSESSLLGQIVCHLCYLAHSGLFIDPVKEVLCEIPILPGQTPMITSSHLASLTYLFHVGEIEFAFDFGGEVPWKIIDANAFWHVGETLYSKDFEQHYRRTPWGDQVKNGHQKSLLCIYNHAVAHGYAGTVTRFELRIGGTYAEGWTLGMLDAIFDTLLTGQYNRIAGSLKRALPTGALWVDLDAINISHPLLHKIIGRWKSWGKSAD